MATKRFYIKSSSDLIARELEKLQNKLIFLEASTPPLPARRVKRTAVYSPPACLEAKRMDMEFEEDDEMFDAPKRV
jgi:hypothetical protein